MSAPTNPVCVNQGDYRKSLRNAAAGPPQKAAGIKKSESIQKIGNTVYGLGAQYGVTLPFSRKHESEADYMGLIFMTMAGYNPSTAITFWQKMSANGGASVPEFMSTHPSDATRISDIKKYLPELEKYKK